MRIRGRPISGSDSNCSLDGGELERSAWEQERGKDFYLSFIPDFKLLTHVFIAQLTPLRCSVYLPYSLLTRRLGPRPQSVRLFPSGTSYQLSILLSILIAPETGFETNSKLDENRLPELIASSFTFHLSPFTPVTWILWPLNLTSPGLSLPRRSIDQWPRWKGTVMSRYLALKELEPLGD
ncbi:hypothetical protein GYMLUDRAFT_249908 [Collybiopsis luxurians FD-317 M1]|uniref:Uncharacterized protein n=1 Tax=Collybiopsis luxurians FD-317 M1 TaxID=944289 RepID=A0A0D0CGI2_9AGAR|nr:hypothetical protein GYMLUDRAFT_249908 [Collybiopsis luxurians FD-317 M1]